LSLTATVDNRSVAADSAHRSNYPIADLSDKRIKPRRILGGLINEYVPAA
jgi:hypothetical protein